MKPLALYLLLVFALTCAMLAVVESIDPAEPALVIDTVPAAAPPGVPQFVCIYIMPEIDRTRRGISRA